MRDPYRGVYGEYKPLTYSIGSVVEAKHQKAMAYKAGSAVINNAANTMKEGFSKIGQSFKNFADSIGLATMQHSEWNGNWTHDEPSSDITKAGDLEANRV
ncbi:hypothetical protein HWC66_gp50 [Gordonia phage Chikenjars]|uniref:Uncharacterized protein n=1 Tax=Gordonia phage Chikenjars TaxID=2601686 RepID=A0A5J6D9H1_9CAUD|nr:hypothetical protein HWC66_gp50 [Gordonia phage Chikenjars]QEQ94353.1 hypothetical protein SEA_CHIKENJARS_50 [Gordonia phage Chikenjars]